MHPSSDPNTAATPRPEVLVLRLHQSIAARISIFGCVVLVLVMSCITAALTAVTTNREREQQAAALAARAEGVVKVIDSVELTSRTMIQRVYPVLASMVGTQVSLEPENDRLIANGRVLNDNFEAVDRFSKETTGVATVFVRHGNDFRRVSTSLVKEDGQRALGTLLDSQGKAYRAVMAGQSYTGRATLFGKAYMTHYDVMRDARNEVVGVLFVGFEIGTFEAAIDRVVQQSRFFASGGMVVIDPRDKPDNAVFVAHPTAKGKRVLEFEPDAKPLLEALAAHPGVVTASVGLFAKDGGDRRAVMSVSEATGQWIVAEVSDSESMRAHWHTMLTFWALLGGACLLLSAALLWTLRRQVGQPLRALSTAARRVAGGDLTCGLRSDRSDEIGQIIRDVDSVRLHFLAVLTTLRRSAQSIAASSVHIADGNSDLSARTEQSADNLQRTASSMEQLTSTVKQTADSAEAARRMASSTSEAAARGAGVMTSVANTMGEINDSSKKISDIVGLINSIAFQTNILALNAAVEAARAGENGRGFAVVATEVRSLAQRSAGAAKEIATLIDRSVANVGNGAQLVTSAGSAMKEIQTEAQRVDERIGEISLATSEQALGIGQVNAAVAELDRSTQQNTSLVHDSTAAAQSLQQEAERLSGMLKAFTL